MKDTVKTGPIYNKDGIPYDYIVIIDAGSKGSRVYVYNWLNPTAALNSTVDLRQALALDPPTDEAPPPSPVPSDTPVTQLFPKINSRKKWHVKIKPGISSFNIAPQKIGKHHIKPLLKLALSVVPKSQHSRTPIFLHSTAGMRLLNPTEQVAIIDNICSYITSNSDFYLPECPLHINVLDGDVEGLYGWLSINSMLGSFDHPENHQHGKNHTTYGLLDMGGASTQVVFEPNNTEVKEHENNLFRINLSPLPLKDADTYNHPDTNEYNVYSDSFLGYGMYQAHNRYFTSLVESYRTEHELPDNFRGPIPDPCLPKGSTTRAVIKDISVDFTGESNFQKCLNNIFPVLSKGTHPGANGESSNCKQFSEENQVSSCLLNDLIPAFDFDINHFVGVSGYWDAITKLLSYDDEEQQAKRSTKETEENKPTKEKDSKEDDSDDEHSDDEDDKDKSKDRPKDKPKDKNKDSKDKDSKNKDKPNNKEDTYDYKLIYEETSKICSQSWSSLLELNNRKASKDRLDEDELSELCFKSSWILNFLHLGLGFPRFGIDDNKTNKFKSLQLIEELDGSTFSWTLGRAILYANDEYIQAYNNYTHDTDGPELIRPGFLHSASPNVYHFGAEQKGVYPRGQFAAPEKGAKYQHFDYESPYEAENHELKWYIEPHRWYGIFIFMGLMGFIAWLMIGRETRTRWYKNTKTKVRRMFVCNYNALPDEETGYELNTVDSPSLDQFLVGSDEE